MNIFYRGYVIHEDIRSICYTIYGPRPERRELAACTTALNSMQWIDGEAARQRAIDELLEIPALR